MPDDDQAALTPEQELAAVREQMATLQAERDAAVHHVKVFPLSPDLIGATPAPDYPYAEWEACVNATARLEAGLIHGALEQVIVGTTHTALSAVLSAAPEPRGP